MLALREYQACPSSVASAWVHCPTPDSYLTGDVANVADLSGMERGDFDIINKDLVDYYYECEDE